jgi:hypothetical protein
LPTTRGRWKGERTATAVGDAHADDAAREGRERHAPFLTSAGGGDGRLGRPVGRVLLNDDREALRRDGGLDAEHELAGVGDGDGALDAGRRRHGGAEGGHPSVARGPSPAARGRRDGEQGEESDAEAARLRSIAFQRSAYRPGVFPGANATAKGCRRCRASRDGV